MVKGHEDNLVNKKLFFFENNTKKKDFLKNGSHVDPFSVSMPNSGGNRRSFYKRHY